MFEAHDAKEAEKMKKMQEEKDQKEEEQRLKERKKYSIPLFWKWASPIFTSVSVKAASLRPY